MPFEIELEPSRLKKMNDFFDDSSYKEYVENATSFNRKLNEERRMRLPYIDGQTGVAQRHYACQRHRRERMPPAPTSTRPGQILAYPQKHWKKKRYQYLKFFLQPKRIFDPEAEMLTINQIENPTLNEDSNQSGSREDARPVEWPYFEEDMFTDEVEHFENSDSDFEYDDYSSKKKKGKSKVGSSGTGGGSKPKGSGTKSGGGGGGSPAKRRTHADNIPDSEKPFSCELCGMRYKTRPGLSYHYNHSHKDRDPSIPIGGIRPSTSSTVSSSGGHHLLHDDNAFHHDDSNSGALPGLSAPSSVGGSSLTPPSTPGGDLSMDGMQGGRQSSRRSATGAVSYRESDLMFGGPSEVEPAPSHTQKSSKALSGKDRAASLGYCDFCLGDAAENKKSGGPEELVSCAECGRSGHPTCLQFTDNMIVSVKEYPWQCIECKTCTLCGTSENDDQLLFCDDCDRGYHMYCLVPPIKEPPEGSWSCRLCTDRFHKRH